MQRVQIAELRDNLLRYLAHVRGGGTVLVIDGVQPVARIVPARTPGPSESEHQERLARLEQQGLIRRGSGGLPDWFGKRRLPKLRGSVLGDLLRERRAGR